MDKSELPIPLMGMWWAVGESRWAGSDSGPTHTEGEHANSTLKGPTLPHSNLLAMRQHETCTFFFYIGQSKRCEVLIGPQALTQVIRSVDTTEAEGEAK